MEDNITKLIEKWAADFNVKKNMCKPENRLFYTPKQIRNAQAQVPMIASFISDLEALNLLPTIKNK